jgi:hypothetical protein
MHQPKKKKDSGIKFNMKNLLKKLFKKRNVTLIVNGRKYKCDELTVVREPNERSKTWLFSLFNHDRDGYFLSVETNGPFIIETGMRD